MSSRSWPGAWAASTSTRTSAPTAAVTAATGTTVAVGEVIRSTTTSRVRGEQAAAYPDTITSSAAPTGKAASTTRAVAVVGGPRVVGGRQRGGAEHGGHALGHVAHPRRAGRVDAEEPGRAL